ncbi:unnamed protein product [Clonostachys chloroleuca]|uniref:Uncharacterized protein n=1 Tax=Clonostachys chloroleuca TaxID=1926264 RepID=A0AA35MD92_9HYPO|nr:unnamed protein product [Clonostachys chloroleuca]
MRFSQCLYSSLLLIPLAVVSGQETGTPRDQETGTYPPIPPATPPPEAVIQTIINGVGDGFLGTQNFDYPLHRPEEVGLQYENVTFISEDGVTSAGWFFPKEGSDKLIIANHPRWFNRGGIRGYTEEEARAPGSYWAVNFIPDYEILHNAGYNVLAYEYRNHGDSDSTYAHTLGLLESQDMVAALNYVHSREDIKNMKIGLFSKCVGANSNLHAYRLHPEAFEGVKAQVFAQPLTVRVRLSRVLELLGISLDYMPAVDNSLYNATNFRFEDYELVPSASLVQIPTFVYQVHDDFNTLPSDVQSVYDAMPIEDKSLYWITGTDRRWDAYSWFQEHPEQVVAWFDRLL